MLMFPDIDMVVQSEERFLEKLKLAKATIVCRAKRDANVCVCF